MTHRLIVDLIQLRWWELRYVLGKKISGAQRLGSSETHLLGDLTTLPTAPGGGARRRNRSQGSAPQETLIQGHLSVLSSGYGRRMNLTKWDYLWFSSQGTGLSTCSPGKDLSKPREDTETFPIDHTSHSSGANPLPCSSDRTV